MKKRTPKKKTLKWKVPRCFNCGVQVDKPALFCTELCQQEASLVRYVRNVRRQGREMEPDIAYVIRVKMAHILNGGYPRKVRQIAAEVREEVIARARGMCQSKGCRNPGTDIDHIRGNSCDLSNLQYLCKKCHEKKTTAVLKPITPDDPRYEEYVDKIVSLRLRFSAKKPVQVCDDHETWNEAQREFMKVARILFAALHDKQ